MKDYLEQKRAELRENEGGFTLMEMLIVVAIIAILIAIAIPVFTGQLEAAREATDAANIRSAYATVTAKALTDGGSYYAAVEMQQQDKGFSGDLAKQQIGGMKLSELGNDVAGNTVYVSVGKDGKVAMNTSSGEAGYKQIDPLTGASVKA